MLNKKKPISAIIIVMLVFIVVFFLFISISKVGENRLGRNVGEVLPLEEMPETINNDSEDSMEENDFILPLPEIIPIKETEVEIGTQNSSPVLPLEPLKEF